MSKLALTVKADRNTIGSPQTAFADVAMLGNELPALGKLVATNVPVLVQHGLSSVPLSLQPGRYRVTATLPSGEYFSEVVDLPPEGTSVTLTKSTVSELPTNYFEPNSLPLLGVPRLSPEASPWEPSVERLLSYFSGSIDLPPTGIHDFQSYFQIEENVATTNKIGAFTGKSTTSQRSSPSKPRRIFDITSTTVAASRPWGEQFEPTSFAIWIESLLHHGGAHQLLPIESGDKSVNHYAYVTARPEDALWALERRNRVRLERVHWYRQRYLIAMTGPLVEQVAIIPISWGGQNIVGEVKDLWDADRGEWNLQVDVVDGDFASVLGYLTQGDNEKALRVLRNPTDASWPDGQNPYAAVVAGYALIYSRDEDIGARDWPAWIQNLATWYPGIPDAQILLATLYLQRRNVLSRLPYHDRMPDTQRLETVWKLLKLAMLAGAPIYSRSARLLVENLEILSYEVSNFDISLLPMFEGLAQALSEAKLIDSCMRSIQPFSVLTLPRK
ncbi:Uncharacterised protein [Burkholderia pseudomallei]|uniref:hypothetical protein n=1 Tax=Burkholderia pseudomallei TaxID=28450 RepID=UPI000F14A2DD|nr:hypothetical protein [Burkholderia pseudomallei]VBT21747.1 Uncharacterised protein [Burkholderia pseudomallei]